VNDDFQYDRRGILHAIDLMGQSHERHAPIDLPPALPDRGLGALATLDRLAPAVLGGAARLGTSTSFAHMDPPTPWVSWATTLWNASLNQNLLHPATGPVAREIEERVIAWLSPFFGMNGGHMTPGSSLANLTALWAARECQGIRQVVASDAAHVSVVKAAHLLGLSMLKLPTHRSGALIEASVPRDLGRSALVLSAGTTSIGTVDPLELCGRAAWTHVDAAWAGPLRLTQYASRLAGLERADSVAVSAHKWLFQPKESALVFFRDSFSAHTAISFGGPYLAAPNIGLLGSHGATAVPLLATLLAWGRTGIAARIEHCVKLADQMAEFVNSDSRLVLLSRPQTGIVVWRLRDESRFDHCFQRLPPGAASITTIGGERWFRMVAANPNADIELLKSGILNAVNG
jgi:L-2,4-diaminobutyrate decarboxylase